MDTRGATELASGSMPRERDPQPGLGQAIRTFRKRRGLSQDALGKRAKIHATWISHIESGRINPTWGNARRLADALRVTLGELADKAMEYEDPEYVGRAPDPPPPPEPPPPPPPPEPNYFPVGPLGKKLDAAVDTLIGFRQAFDEAADDY